MSACVSRISVLSSSSLFFIPFMLTCSIVRFSSFLLLGLCACVCSVSCVVVLESSSVCRFRCDIADTLCSGCSVCGDRVAGFVFSVCAEMRRSAARGVARGDGGAGDVRAGGGVSVGVYMGGTRGLGNFPFADDVCEISRMRGVMGVGELLTMCMCLAPGGVRGVGREWISGLGLGLGSPGGTGCV